MVSSPVCLSLLVLSSYTLASPLPQAADEGRDFDKETAGTTAQLAQEIIESISNVFTKTGQLVNTINEDIGHQQISRHADYVSDLGDNLDEDTAEALTDGFTMLQDHLPTLKGHVKTVLDKVPDIKSTINEQIDNSPSKETIKSYISDFFKSLPESWSHPAIDEARDTVLETIDSLPTKEVVKKHVEDVAQNIPSTDYVHDKIDDYVDVLGSAVDEFNETDAVDA